MFQQGEFYSVDTLGFCAIAAFSVCQARLAHFTRTGNSRTPASDDSLPMSSTGRSGGVVTIRWNRSKSASASMMTDAIKGHTVEEAGALFERFHKMVTTPPELPVEDMGKLSSLAGVREFPVRVKCASLAWHTLKAAMEQKSKVSTE